MLFPRLISFFVIFTGVFGFNKRPVSFLLHVLMASQAVGASVSGRHRGRWQAAVSARRKFDHFYGVLFLSVDRLSLFCSCVFFSFFFFCSLLFFSALVFFPCGLFIYALCFLLGLPCCFFLDSCMLIFPGQPKEKNKKQLI